MLEQPIIQVENISWQVGDKSILSDISFTVKKGQFVGIIGPNGAGKSSVLSCIFGKIKNFSGKALIDSKDVNEYSRTQLAQKVAVVLQEPATHFELTVYDVIAMGLTPRKPLLSFNSGDDEQAIIDAAIRVDLKDKLTRQFSSLSGGEKQRAIIARAIVQNTPILLMDEPTNHLDIKHQIEIISLAKNLGISVLLTVHDLNLAANYCDKLILLNDGKLVAKGTVKQVLTESVIADVFGVNAKVAQTDKSNTQIEFDYLATKNNKVV